HLAPIPGTGAPRIPAPKDFWNSVGGQADHWRKLPYGGRGMLTDSDAHDDDTVYRNVETGVSIGRMIHAGDTIGYVSDANHVHWEVRNAPIADKGPPTLTTSGRYDPIEYFKQNYNLQLPSGVTIPRASGGGGVGALLLLAALAFGKRKRGRR
ncbi:MAG: hypothetical protein ACM32F_07830, partial [Betaproteobacteria bacterium]